MIILILILLSGCHVNQELDTTALLEYKKPFLLPQEHLELDLDAPSLQEMDELSRFSVKPTHPFNGKVEEALKDLDDLEWLIKTHYGLYPLYKQEYDDAFIEMREELSDYHIVSRADLSALFYKHIDFDENYHFTLDGKNYRLRKPNEYDLTQTFIKEDDQFINIETNEKMNDDSSLVPFLYPDFEVFYHPKNMPKANNTSERDQQFELLVLDESIPYAHQSEMIFDNSAYSNFAQQVRDSTEIAVLDLRNNSGGFENYPGQWFMQLTRSQPLLSHQGYIRDNPEFVDAIFRVPLNRALGVSVINNQYQYVASDTILEKEGLIIVLQNQHTMSGAEKMIDMLHHLDNTIFIGTPTKGGYISNQLELPYFLRQSGLVVQFGNSYFDFNPNYFRENEGFEPDLYVLDDNMQEVIESLLYKINAK